MNTLKLNHVYIETRTKEDALFTQSKVYNFWMDNMKSGYSNSVPEYNFDRLKFFFLFNLSVRFNVKGFSRGLLVS